MESSGVEWRADCLNSCAARSLTDGLDSALCALPSALCPPPSLWQRPPPRPSPPPGHCTAQFDSIRFDSPSDFSQRPEIHCIVATLRSAVGPFAMSETHSSVVFGGGEARDSNLSSFTTGRRVVITKRKQQQQMDEEQQSSEQSGRRGHGRRDRPRVSVKERRPTGSGGLATSGDTEAAAAAATGDELASDSAAALSSDSVGTASRRRVVEVRQRGSRDSRLNERRDALSDQSSGFNTGRGQRRALIVLPKNAEKMAAREQLMQIHPHIAQVFRGINPPDEFTQEPFTRVLAADAPTMPYRRRNQEVKTVVQWSTH